LGTLPIYKRRTIDHDAIARRNVLSCSFYRCWRLSRCRLPSRSALPTPCGHRRAACDQGRCGDLAPRGQRGGCGCRRGIRARRDASFCGQPRRRRIHADSLCGCRSTFIDFREQAPAGASRDMYLDAAGNPTRDSIDGWRASGVPERCADSSSRNRNTAIANGRIWSHRRSSSPTRAFPSRDHGPFARRRTLEAREGSRIAPHFSRQWCASSRGTSIGPAGAGANVDAHRPGRRQRILRGRTAQELARAMAAHGGLVTLDDLRTIAPWNALLSRVSIATFPF